MGLWIIENVLYLLLTIATAFCFIWLYQSKEQLRLKTWMLVPIALLHTVIGVLCVKVFAFFESGDGSNMSLYGAIFFLPIVYYLGAKLTKRNIACVFDVLTICIIVTLLCARFNCIMSGCCLGLPIPGLENARFPTREAEIAFYLILFTLLRKKLGKTQCRGLLYPIYMMSYGVFRFVVEFFRESAQPIIGSLHISHIWSFVSIAVGVAAYYKLSHRVADKINQENNRVKESNK